MRKYIFKIIIFQIAFLVIFSNIVNASSFKFIAEAENEVIKIGETATIQLTVDQIDAGEYGINVVEMWFEYDKDVFENVEFVEENSWRVEYNEQTGKILFVKMVAGVNEKENIGKIKLKSRNDLKNLDTEVKLKEITSNDGYELLDEGDRIIKFRIEEEVKPTPTLVPTQEPTKEPTKEPTQKPVQQTPIATVAPTVKPTVAPTKKPPVANIVENIKTGDIKPIIAIIIVVFVIIINVVYFIIIKRKSSQKNNK